MKMDKIDLCLALKGINVLPFFKTLKDMVYSKVPQLPKQCPVKPLKLYVENITIISPEMIGEIKKLIGTFTKTLLPNGIYRGFMKFYGDDDPEGIHIIYHAELNFRLNDEVF